VTAEAAAALLGTSPTILSLWEERFGYPVSERSSNGQPLYPDEAMIALRDALTRELSIASAITRAQRVQSTFPVGHSHDTTHGRFPRWPGTPSEA
jgi:hypothetical protein